MSRITNSSATRRTLSTQPALRELNKNARDIVDRNRIPWRTVFAFIARRRSTAAARTVVVLVHSHVRSARVVERSPSPRRTLSRPGAARTKARTAHHRAGSSTGFSSPESGLGGDGTVVQPTGPVLAAAYDSQQTLVTVPVVRQGDAMKRPGMPVGIQHGPLPRPTLEPARGRYSLSAALRFLGFHRVVRP